MVEVAVFFSAAAAEGKQKKVMNSDRKSRKTNSKRAEPFFAFVIK
jgi:hypothetical protein